MAHREFTGPDGPALWGGAMIDVYTDGSANPHDGGSGGWAFVIVKRGQAVGKMSGGFRNGQTVNTMELMAIRECIKRVPGRLTIHTDSKNAIGWLRWGYKCKYQHLRNIINQIKSLEKERGNTVSLKHIKGHAGHEFNEMADRLSKKARKRAIKNEEKRMGRKIKL